MTLKHIKHDYTMYIIFDYTLDDKGFTTVRGCAPFNTDNFNIYQQKGVLVGSYWKVRILFLSLMWKFHLFQGGYKFHWYPNWEIRSNHGGLYLHHFSRNYISIMEDIISTNILIGKSKVIIEVFVYIILVEITSPLWRI